MLLPFFGDLLIRLQPHESSYWPWGFLVLNPDLMKADGLIWPKDCPFFFEIGNQSTAPGLDKCQTWKNGYLAEYVFVYFRVNVPCWSYHHSGALTEGRFSLCWLGTEGWVTAASHQQGGVCRKHRDNKRWIRTPTFEHSLLQPTLNDSGGYLKSVISWECGLYFDKTPHPQQ